MLPRDSSPGDEVFPLPSDRQSDRLRKALSEVGARCEFRDGVDPLKTRGIRTSFKTIQRVSERVGAEVARARPPRRRPTRPSSS